MTKVQIKLPLSRPLTDEDLKSISHVHSVYGFFATRIEPSGKELFVEYDASRLSPKEVQGTLAENGIPIAD